ncbi:NACHT domain-containing protein [Paenibacillus sp. IITD108]|uniref:NACHT domain-containing protein n=1 Tax=Paenibacillus sp. IITD108 TaxID=3116649 RepID=UPI002F415E78
MAIDTILINITSNFLYDLIKCINNRTRLKTIESLVKSKESILLKSDLTENSGSFYKFLELTSTRMSFLNFIRYNSFKHHYKKNDVNFGLNKNKFLENLSECAIVFVKNNSGKNLNELEVKNYFHDVLEIIEEKMIDNLPKELLSIPYYLSLAVQELEEKIFEINRTKSEIANINFEQIRIDYVKNLKARYKKSHVYGIDRLDLTEFYIFPKFFIEQRIEDNSITINSQSKIIDWQNSLNISNIISIIGGPGFGKTLFLKNLINNFEDLNIFEGSNLLPIYCNLKEYTNFSKKKSSAYSIEDYLVDSMIFNTGIDNNLITKDFLRYYINSGRCLLLFDALDEVDVEEREHISEIIVSFFKTSNKNNKVCITTRERGLIPETPVVLRVLPIKKTEIESYLRKMSIINKFDSEDIPLFLSQCESLIQRGFLTNFLMVALMVNIFKSERELPENKIQLYKSCTDYISRKREINDKRVTYKYDLIRTLIGNDLTFEELSFLCKRTNKEADRIAIEKCLSKAYRTLYLDGNQLLNAIDEFLTFCSERTELFVQGSEDHYKFFHRSFFEYFYAKHIIKTHNNNELFEELLNFTADSELFELTIALLKNEYYGRYQEFLDHIFYICETTETIKEIPIVVTMLLEFMVVADEEYYWKRFYGLCFGDKELLSYLDDESDKVYNVLTRFGDVNTLYENLVRYYKTHVIGECAIFYPLSKFIIPRVIHTGNNAARWFVGIEAISKNNVIEKMIKLITFEEFQEALSMFSIEYRKQISEEDLEYEDGIFTDLSEESENLSEYIYRHMTGRIE